MADQAEEVDPRDEPQFVRLYGPVKQYQTIGPKVPGGEELPLDVSRVELQSIADGNGPGQYVAWTLNGRGHRVSGSQVNVTVDDPAKDRTPDPHVDHPSPSPSSSLAGDFAARMLDSQHTATRDQADLARRVIDQQREAAAAADARLEAVVDRIGEHFQGAVRSISTMADQVAEERAARARAEAELAAARAHQAELERIRAEYEDASPIDVEALVRAFGGIMRPQAPAPSSSSPADPFDTARNEDPFNG